MVMMAVPGGNSASAADMQRLPIAGETQYLLTSHIHLKLAENQGLSTPAFVAFVQAKNHWSSLTCLLTRGLPLFRGFTI